ncbi:MAG: aminopeptidase [Thermoleophilia bacterium]|nr:aminopeptidase [Thermoleophilia bacterium]
MDASTQTSPSTVPDRETLERYADLIVGLGANVQPGQLVEIRAELDKAELVREVAASAYRRGARYVSVAWHDPYLRRARILHSEHPLDYVAPWDTFRVQQLGERRAARISISPMNPPELFADVEPAQVALEPYDYIPAYQELVRDRTTNWVGVACPSEGWADRVHPELRPAEALAKLWEEVLHICRLDEPDPVAAWERRFDELTRVCGAMNERRFDALHFEGPGTDLTLGLFPTSRWAGGPHVTVDGLEHVPNIPTEEIFTAPDPARADGFVRATKPFLLKTGALVEGLVVRFEGGRAVQIDADAGADSLREYVATNEGADRLGEVALVDREGRIGPLGSVFFNTLYDENAASHLALGSAYLDTVGDEDRVRANRSTAHADFMIGGEDVDVTGITRDGDRVPVLRGGAWQ